MNENLKRIEEKHRESPVRGTDDTGYCYEDDLPYPCDVVKLARALHEAMEQLRYHLARNAADDAERTLKEIAND